MGLGRYLRQRIAAPITQRIDLQSELLFEMHHRELMRSAPYNQPGRLEPHGFRSFSQNDEDGILQEIFRRIGVGAGTFVEFGVQTGLREQLPPAAVSGLARLVDRGGCGGVSGNPARVRAELGSGQLQLAHGFVTRENIAGLIAAARFEQLDLLSIDIDGNDYWIWEALTIQPRVVVIEYNAKFRPPTSWVMEYNAAHRWD